MSRHLGHLVGALVGFGHVAEYAHVPALRDHPSLRLGAVVDPDAERRRRALQLFGGAIRTYSSVSDLLAWETPAFVDVAAPPVARVDVIESVAAAGAHLLVEKPLALCRRDLVRIERAIDRTGVVLMTVHNWHHAPVFRAAMREVISGTIGEIREMEFRTERAGPAGGPGSWRLRAAVAGGGILIDHGWHQLYLARAVIGAHPRTVAAKTECRQWTNGDVEDTVVCHVTFDNGTSLRLHLTWAARARHTSVRVQGDLASLHLDDGSLSLVDKKGTVRSVPVSVDGPDDSYHARWFPPVLDAFADAMKSPARARPNRREATMCCAVIEAAYRSAARDGVATPVRLGDDHGRERTAVFGNGDREDRMNAANADEEGRLLAVGMEEGS